MDVCGLRWLELVSDVPSTGVKKWLRSKMIALHTCTSGTLSQASSRRLGPVMNSRTGISPAPGGKGADGGKSVGTAPAERNLHKT